MSKYTPLTLAQKISNKAVKATGLKNYLDIVRKVSNKEAFALAVTTLDKSVAPKDGDFTKWVAGGYSHSKRAMRVFHDVMETIDTPEAKAVLAAKKDYIYSVCKGQNIKSTNLYRANRVKFLEQADAVLAAM